MFTIDRFCNRTVYTINSKNSYSNLVFSLKKNTANGPTLPKTRPSKSAAGTRSSTDSRGSPSRAPATWSQLTSPSLLTTCSKPSSTETCRFSDSSQTSFERLKDRIYAILLVSLNFAKTISIDLSFSGFEFNKLFFIELIQMPSFLKFINAKKYAGKSHQYSSICKVDKSKMDQFHLIQHF